MFCVPRLQATGGKICVWQMWWDPNRPTMPNFQRPPEVSVQHPTTSLSLKFRMLQSSSTSSHLQFPPIHHYRFFWNTWRLSLEDAILFFCGRYAVAGSIIDGFALLFVWLCTSASCPHAVLSLHKFVRLLAEAQQTAWALTWTFSVGQATTRGMVLLSWSLA